MKNGNRSRPKGALPRIVTVAGLTKSGKTTVASALIRELRSRGFRVGSVKTIRHHPLSLDEDGMDTRRHAEAGAEFTVALLDGEIAYFEPRSLRPGLSDAARLFKPGVQYVVWEGMADPEAGGGQVVCLKEMADLDVTLVERRVPKESIIAISGVVAGQAVGNAENRPLPEVPIVDVAPTAGASLLADLVLGWFDKGCG